MTIKKKTEVCTEVCTQTSKNCEKLEKLQFLLKLLNSSARKIAIFADACKPGHKSKKLGHAVQIHVCCLA